MDTLLKLCPFITKYHDADGVLVKSKINWNSLWPHYINLRKVWKIENADYNGALKVPAT